MNSSASDSVERHWRWLCFTVRRILARHREARGEKEVIPARKAPLPRKRKTDAHRQRIADLLQRYPKITAVRVFEEIKADGYTGGLSILRQEVKSLRPRPSREPIVRFETEPGQQGQMDWSFYTLNFT